MTLKDRLEYILQNENLKQKELASALNTSPQTVHNWLKRGSISREAAQSISDIFGYSLDWLLSGIGEPKIKRGTNARGESNVPPMDEWRGVSTWDSKTPLNDDEVEVPYYKSIELAAGHGSNGGSDSNGYKLRFSKSTLRRYGISAKDVASFPVHGDSMSPVIPNGSTVFVNQADHRIVDGGIYFIEQDGLLRIKMLYRQPGKLIIKSYNSIDFPDEEADPKDVKIIGRIFNWSVMAY
ncbi:helix-turn-helix transcriptional regulator [Providencia vermicola]|uniref:LexA family transcriptional regulator n=1 Tax=Providencia vermicola TaxID=333965 RepID=UPI00214FBF96|nr:helix-turn-helix transcriptional regulator [Providencia vermicola]MCR4178845.1 helix-turn-helix transcriptional regulator [Providencia vermicola]